MFDVMCLFTSTMVCELILGDVIQGGVCLVLLPRTPQLHYINYLELIFENVMYTLARNDYIHKILFSELISRKITWQLQEHFNFPKITYQVFVCDSENCMEQLFGNYFLGRSHFSYMK